MFETLAYGLLLNSPKVSKSWESDVWKSRNTTMMLWLANKGLFKTATINGYFQQHWDTSGPLTNKMNQYEADREVCILSLSLYIYNKQLLAIVYLSEYITNWVVVESFAGEENQERV